jgi:bifunctional DNA-binding transcriptional regulator/antitoxin component of YhaV-PrlF toxin-antitoxin module
MIFLHDNNPAMSASTLTERGQISVPASLRKAMKLRTGQRLKWEMISPREIRVVVEAGPAAGPLSVLGYARKLRDRPSRRTQEWMRELREGEDSP